MQRVAPRDFHVRGLLIDYHIEMSQQAFFLSFKLSFYRTEK